jgi:hypothetical protein
VFRQVASDAIRRLARVLSTDPSYRSPPEDQAAMTTSHDK